MFQYFQYHPPPGFKSKAQSGQRQALRMEQEQMDNFLRSASGDEGAPFGRPQEEICQWIKGQDALLVSGSSHV